MIRCEKATRLGTIAAAKMRARMNWNSSMLKNDLSPARKSVAEIDPLFSFILEVLGERRQSAVISIGAQSWFIHLTKKLEGDLKSCTPRLKRELSSWKEISRSEIKMRLEFLKGNLALQDRKENWVLALHNPVLYKYVRKNIPYGNYFWQKSSHI